MATGDNTSLSDRKRRAGQRLVIGCPGLSPDAEFRRLCSDVVPAGFILFARNVEEPAQVRELNRELGSLVPASLPPLLAVDQEGGRVQRIQATAWPPARWLGNAGDPALTRRVAEAIGDELRALGFNADFAPVADVDSNPKNPVIGDRSFSRDAAVCARHVAAFVDGLHGRGIVATAKHFPGHGDTAQDSHEDLPVVEKDPDDVRHCELVPFRAAARAGAGMVMTAHVMYPTFDEEVPATMSERILGGLLRDEIGYDGIVVSDDLEMKAVRGRFPLDQQLELASRATVDLFLVCHTPALMVDAWETLVRLQEREHRYDDLATDSLGRLTELRKRFFRAPPFDVVGSVVGSSAHRDLALEVEARGRAG